MESSEKPRTDACPLEPACRVYRYSPISWASFSPDDIDFPAGKERIIDHLRAAGAPGEIISAIRMFSDRVYNTEQDMVAELSRTFKLQIEQQGTMQPPNHGDDMA